ncbi:MAG TPA: hypothetical protein VF406_00135 [Thermodesulfobacteriota bacterium]
MTQLVLDVRAARTSDPVTSHVAARAITASGARQTQADQVLALVRLFPDQTAGELAAHSARMDDVPLDSVQVTRRLGDLERAGLVTKTGRRHCSIHGRLMSTWRVREGT